MVRFSAQARADLRRIALFLVAKDPRAAKRAVTAVRRAAAGIALHPHMGRPVVVTRPVLREWLVPFGGAGYWLLYEIESPPLISVLAVRHQREGGYDID